MKRTLCALIAALGIAGAAGCKREAPVESDYQGLLSMPGRTYHLEFDEEGNLAAMRHPGSAGDERECFYVLGQRKRCDNLGYELSPETIDTVKKVLGPYNRLRFQLAKERFEGFGK